MNRRMMLTGAAAALFVSEARAETVDVEALLGRLKQLRERLEKAGTRAIERYMRKMPEGMTLPEDTKEIIRNGLGAFSVMPSLRRMSPAEQSHPEVQALIADVVLAVGTYALTARESLEQILSQPASEKRLHQLLLDLKEQDDDEDFGRSSFISLREGKKQIREEIGAHGPAAMVAKMKGYLDELANAEVPEELLPLPEEGKEKIRAKSPILKGLAVVAGLLLLGVAIVAGVYTLMGLIFAVTGGSLGFLGVIVAILAGLVTVAAAFGAWAAFRTLASPAPYHSLDGNHVIVKVLAEFRWIDTKVHFGEMQPELSVNGSVQSPWLVQKIYAEGVTGKMAGEGAPAPELPLGALVAQVGDWRGMVLGAGETVGSQKREGLLELVVNVPEAEADHVDGGFVVNITLRPQP